MKLRSLVLVGGALVVALAVGAYLGVAALERRVDEALEQARVSVDRLAELRVASRGFVGFSPVYRLRGVTIVAPGGVKIGVEQFVLSDPALHPGLTIGYRTLRVTGATVAIDGGEVAAAQIELTGLRPVQAADAKSALDRFTAETLKIAGIAIAPPDAAARITLDAVEARDISRRRTGEIGWNNLRVTAPAPGGAGSMTIAAMRLTGFELLGDFKADWFKDPAALPPVFKFDRFEMRGTEVVSGKGMVKAPSLLVESTRWQDGESVEGSLALPGVAWAGTWDAATAAILDTIFAGEQTASLSSTWKRDLATTRMRSDITLESGKVGRLGFGMDMAGVPVSAAFKSPEDLPRLLADLAIVSAELVYTDHGVTPRLLDLAAAQRGVAKEALLAEAGQNVAMMLSSLSPRSRISPAQIDAFLRRPHQLRLGFAPAAPVKLMQIGAVAPPGAPPNVMPFVQDMTLSLTPKP